MVCVFVFSPLLHNKFKHKINDEILNWYNQLSSNFSNLILKRSFKLIKYRKLMFKFNDEDESCNIICFFFLCDYCCNDSCVISITKIYNNRQHNGIINVKSSRSLNMYNVYLPNCKCTKIT